MWYNYKTTKKTSHCRNLSGRSSQDYVSLHETVLKRHQCTCPKQKFVGGLKIRIITPTNPKFLIQTAGGESTREGTADVEWHGGRRYFEYRQRKILSLAESDWAIIA